MYDIEAALRDYTDNWGDSLVYQAAAYSLLSPGKRIRPILAIEAFKAVGGEGDVIMPYACALEMIHASSLIVDDIMDNDDYRRGLLACHKKFGLGTAILASHLLVNYALAIAADLTCLDELLNAGRLMAIGQQDEIDALKTGALIKTAVRIGGFIGGCTNAELEALTIYGEQIGLLFQVTDDILDGETPKQEAPLDLSCLDIFGTKADRLREIAIFIKERTR